MMLHIVSIIPSDLKIIILWKGDAESWLDEIVCVQGLFLFFLSWGDNRMHKKTTLECHDCYSGPLHQDPKDDIKIYKKNVLFYRWMETALTFGPCSCCAIYFS